MANAYMLMGYFDVIIIDIHIIIQFIHLLKIY